MREEVSAFDPDRLVTLREYTNPIMANWVQSVLASAGIPALLLDTHGESSFIRCQVPAGARQDAELILSEMFERRSGADAGSQAGPTPPPSGTSSPGVIPEKPGPFGRTCPDCGSRRSKRCPAPDHSRDPLLTRLINRLQGRGWQRCTRCGRTWRI